MNSLDLESSLTRFRDIRTDMPSPIISTNFAARQKKIFKAIIAVYTSIQKCRLNIDITLHC